MALLIAFHTASPSHNDSLTKKPEGSLWFLNAPQVQASMIKQNLLLDHFSAAKESHKTQSHKTNSKTGPHFEQLELLQHVLVVAPRGARAVTTVVLPCAKQEQHFTCHDRRPRCVTWRF